MNIFGIEVFKSIYQYIDLKLFYIVLYNGSMHRSLDCFRLGWPMRADADFFQQRKTNNEENGVSFLVMHVCKYLNTKTCFLNHIVLIKN